MSPTDGKVKQEEMRRSIETREKRRRQWQREGERSIGENLALIGVLGWLIVVPTLIGVFIGRWLDRTYHMGIFWTATFIFLGLVLGCYLAWKRVEKG